MEQLVDSNNVEDFNYSSSGLAANITAELILPESGEQLSHGDEGFGRDGDCVKVTYASACVKLGCGDLDHHVNLSRTDICKLLRYEMNLSRNELNKNGRRVLNTENLTQKIDEALGLSGTMMQPIEVNDGDTLSSEMSTPIGKI